MWPLSHDALTAGYSTVSVTGEPDSLALASPTNTRPPKSRAPPPLPKKPRPSARTRMSRSPKREAGGQQARAHAPAVREYLRARQSTGPPGAASHSEQHRVGQPLGGRVERRHGRPRIADVAVCATAQLSSGLSSDSGVGVGDEGPVFPAAARKRAADRNEFAERLLLEQFDVRMQHYWSLWKLSSMGSTKVPPTRASTRCR